MKVETELTEAPKGLRQRFMRLERRKPADRTSLVAIQSIRSGDKGSGRKEQQAQSQQSERRAAAGFREEENGAYQQQNDGNDAEKQRAFAPIGPAPFAVQNTSPHWESSLRGRANGGTDS